MSLFPVSGAHAVQVSDIRYSYFPNKKRKEDTSVAEALQGLSFEVPQGKITGLLGPNGSGKSTTFKILSTQLTPSQGVAKIFGIDVEVHRAEARKFLGVTFQSPSLDPLLSVFENLQTFAALYGMSGEPALARIEELLKVFGLTARRNDRINTLSGGLARRVELAKALLPNPRLLMLDEPTTGLDPKLRREFWLELARLRDQGISILVTTHLMDEAELCDELIFINEGRFAGQGRPQKLKEDFGLDILFAEFGSNELVPETTLKEILKDGETLRVEAGSARIETKRALELLNTLAARFGGALQAVSWGKPTLADVYFAKTGKSL